jgi:hypothetical protein
MIKTIRISRRYLRICFRSEKVTPVAERDMIKMREGKMNSLKWEA